MVLRNVHRSPLAVALAAFIAVDLLFASPISAQCTGSQIESNLGVRALAEGETWTLRPDDHTGDEATAQPKEDRNDGKNGDNPYYQRHNVTKAHCGGCSCYWYTSKHGPDDLGNPDPGADQYVDYRPPFECLGEGTYEIKVSWRSGENRAAYKALYVVHHRDGEDSNEYDQRKSSSGSCGYGEMGAFDMEEGSYVRVVDKGEGSITFSMMMFTLVKADSPSTGLRNPAPAFVAATIRRRADGTVRIALPEPAPLTAALYSVDGRLLARHRLPAAAEHTVDVSGRAAQAAILRASRAGRILAEERLVR